MGSFANYIFTYAFYSVFVSTGVLTNNPGMITWAEAFFTNNLWMVLLGTVFMVYLTLIMLPGVRFYLRQQIVFWTIGMFGTIVAIVILLGATPATFAVAFNAALGHYTTYENVISTAKSYGFTWAPSWSATFSAMAFAWLINNGYQYSGYFSGEVRNVRKSMILSTMGNNVFCTFFYALYAWAFVNAVGDNWLHSLSYLAYAQPSSYTIPVIPNPYFLATLLTNNIVIASVINISLLAWAIIIIPSNWMALTRILLAMGFDRVLPAKFADVSDKWHTPVKSILFVSFLTWLGMVASFYYGIVFAQMNYTLEYAIILSIGGLTGMLFPYVRKSMYEKSPIVSYKVAGIPLVSIGGAVSFVFFAFLAYFSAVNPAVSGPTSPPALIVGALSFVIAGSVYYLARVYHKKKDGIDISQAFLEIPPE
jgi:amino acid transporter